ncbi:MAG: ferrous iron transporter B [Candidatus Obscuribacter sp.]|nr:ferrous iron transporter B [Candidatus Obscuribacter sp.]
MAVQKKGIKAIEESIEDACLSHLETETLQQIKVLTKDQDGTEILTQAEALLLAEGDLTTAENVQNRNINLTEKLSGISRPEIYARRRQLVNDLTNKYVKRTKGTQALSTSLGRLLLHPVWGSLISFAVCYLIFYQMLGVWIAGNLVDITEKQTMKVYYEPFVRRLAANVFPDTITIKDKQFAFAQGTLAEPAKAKELDEAIKTVKGDEIEFDFWSFRTPMAYLGNIIVGEYGLATLTVTYLLGLLMPLVIGFYLGLSLMEDSGYLPRLAVLVDRMMNKIGLNGRAIIPLILGLGCVTMATITTRLLTSKREKIIATALLGVAIPCSAQLGVVSGTLARAGGAAAWAVYLTMVVGILAVTGLLLNMVLPGKSTGLMIDLPPMRLPRLDNVLSKTWKNHGTFWSMPHRCFS